MRKIHGSKPSRDVKRDIQFGADSPCIEEIDPWEWESRHQFGHEPVTQDHGVGFILSFGAQPEHRSRVSICCVCPQEHTLSVLAGQPGVVVICSSKLLQRTKPVCRASNIEPHWPHLIDSPRKFGFHIEDRQGEALFGPPTCRHGQVSMMQFLSLIVRVASCHCPKPAWSSWRSFGVLQRWDAPLLPELESCP